MAVTKEQVLAALATVKSPGVETLTDARVLSNIVVSDGKVFFSITVNAADVKAWEPVRDAAEAAVKAVPGVKSALVALTAERAGGQGARPAPAAPAARPAPDHRRLFVDEEADRHHGQAVALDRLQTVAADGLGLVLDGEQLRQ